MSGTADERVRPKSRRVLALQLTQGRVAATAGTQGPEVDNCRGCKQLFALLERPFLSSFYIFHASKCRRALLHESYGWSSAPCYSQCKARNAPPSRLL